MKTTFKFLIKHMALVVILIGLSSKALCQINDESSLGTSEIKINGLTTILGYLELSYDKILNDESSIGLSIGFSFDDSVDYSFAIVPNYRFFFGNIPAEGFFIEANAAIFSEEYDVRDNFGMTEKESAMGFGMGLAIGNKFVTTKNGYVGEIFAGAGRNFNNEEGANEVYPRIGISIGKRF